MRARTRLHRVSAALRHRLVVPATAVLAIATQGTAGAGCLDGDPLRGVNLAGAEFNADNALPGKLWHDYVYPGDAMIADFARRGVSAIRVPVRWERLQRELNGPLRDVDRRSVERIIAEASEQGICVLLDVHNYGTYHDQRIGSSSVPASSFVDLWQRLADLGGPEHLALDLMNEPVELSVSTWQRVAQDTVKALRDDGFKHLILVSGGRWSGVHDWQQAGGDVSNADAFSDFDDPLDRTLIQVHQYPDTNYSGMRENCYRPAHFEPMFEAITDWARNNGQELFLGEFGARDTRDCLDSLGRIVQFASRDPAWRGWTYWAAGPWWGDYPLALQMGDDHKPRWQRIEPYLPGGEG